MKYILLLSFLTVLNLLAAYFGTRPYLTHLSMFSSGICFSATLVCIQKYHRIRAFKKEVKNLTKTQTEEIWKAFVKDINEEINQSVERIVESTHDDRFH